VKFEPYIIDDETVPNSHPQEFSTKFI